MKSSKSTHISEPEREMTLLPRLRRDSQLTPIIHMPFRPEFHRIRPPHQRVPVEKPNVRYDEGIGGNEVAFVVVVYGGSVGKTEWGNKSPAK